MSPGRCGRSTVGRRPTTRSEEVFTPTSDKFLSESTGTEPPAPPPAQSPEFDAPQRDEDGHLGEPEDYVWGLASG